jgi:hypothetical protein
LPREELAQKEYKIRDGEKEKTTEGSILEITNSQNKALQDDKIDQSVSEDKNKKDDEGLAQSLKNCRQNVKEFTEELIENWNEDMEYEEIKHKCKEFRIDKEDMKFILKMSDYNQENDFNLDLWYANYDFIWIILNSLINTNERINWGLLYRLKQTNERKEGKQACSISRKFQMNFIAKEY